MKRLFLLSAEVFMNLEFVGTWWSLIVMQILSVLTAVATCFVTSIMFYNLGNLCVFKSEEQKLYELKIWTCDTKL